MKRSARHSGKKKFFALFISMLVLISSSCMNYYKVSSVNEDKSHSIQEFQESDKYIILHHDEKAWFICDIEMDGDALQGKIYELPDYRKKYLGNKKKKLNRYRHKTESHLLNEVHIYTEKTIIRNDTVRIQVQDIYKIDVYEINQLATTCSWLIGFFGPLVIGIFMILQGGAIGASPS